MARFITTTHSKYPTRKIMFNVEQIAAITSDGEYTIVYIAGDAEPFSVKEPLEEIITQATIQRG